MFNIDKPNLQDLPSLSQLRRSALIAVIGAGLLLVSVVLPAEYGIDPTGAGRVLGLTEMGNIKHELHHEAESDRAENGDEHSFNLIERTLGLFISSAYAEEAWSDALTFTLEPGEYTETKLVMKAGDQTDYAWTASGGRINFDLHAHGGGQSKTYEKGRGATDGNGNFVAPFDGEHGWFWRNRDKSPVTITLKIKGDYQEIVRSQHSE
jgi:hypothetical protein